jgi:hypothetical protein
VSTDRFTIKQRGEHRAIIVLREAVVDEANLPLVEELAVAVVGRNDDELLAVERDMALDQRQGSLADRAEADHDDGAVETGVQLEILRRAGDRIHVIKAPGRQKGYAACRAALLFARTFAVAGRGARRPVAVMRPAAPSRAPGSSSQASSRSRS